LSLLIVSCFALPASANDYLTPLDFGFGMLEHGRVDYCNPPPHTLAGNFNSDDYPDIARFDGNRLEIFISTSYGYSSDPQQVKTFDKPIASLGFGGTVWDTHPPLKVVFTDGTEELFYLRRGMLDLDGDVLSSPSPHPPRTISEADFQIVWESENYPHIANRATVGYFDNDGIIEVVTWWKESAYADTAWIDIYKVVGDNTYELWKREPLVFEGPNPGLSQLLITDVDRNGLKELVYTGEDAYFWEFDNAGNYQVMRSNFTFPRPVMDVKECDFDQDCIY
ncbi:hypothetical protein KKA00_03645, partial [bacterium]|nr:hypothetical protein [bacterium]